MLKERKNFDMLVHCEPESGNYRLSIMLTRIFLEGEIPEDLKVSHKNITNSEKRNQLIRSIIQLLENSIEE